MYAAQVLVCYVSVLVLDWRKIRSANCVFMYGIYLATMAVATCMSSTIYIALRCIYCTRLACPCLCIDLQLLQVEPCLPVHLLHHQHLQGKSLCPEKRGATMVHLSFADLRDAGWVRWTGLTSIASHMSGPAGNQRAHSASVQEPSWHAKCPTLHVQRRAVDLTFYIVCAHSRVSPEMLRSIGVLSRFVH